MNKKIGWIFISFLLMVLLFLSPLISLGASSSQTIDIPVISDVGDINPAVYWWQKDNGEFVADYTGASGQTQIHVDYYGNRSNAVPVNTNVRNKINVMQYFKGDFESANRQKFKTNDLHSYKIRSAEFRPSDHYKGTNMWFSSSEPNHVIFTAETGSSYTPTSKSVNGTSPDGHPKFAVRYDTPLTVQWEGIVKETKEIRVLEDYDLLVNDTVNMKAEVRTKLAKKDWESWVDVGNRTSETTWSSSDSSVATVR